MADHRDPGDGMDTEGAVRGRLLADHRDVLGRALSCADAVASAGAELAARPGR